MVMGVPPPDNAAQHAGRGAALRAAHEPDADALRAAEQMREAGLKYRPAMVTPVVLVALGLVVIFAILAIVSN